MHYQYPEPAQLQLWAKEPMPFHHPTDLSLDDDYHLHAEVENVKYQFKPTYIMVETELDNFENLDGLDGYDFLDHESAWETAADVQIEEDYICATGFVVSGDEPEKFDAYWLLETVTVTNPTTQ